MPAKTAAMNAAAEFDIGPLSWVRLEIDQALARGLELLGTYADDPSDPTPLKQARSHVHQAAGAIRMVGLDAVVVYTDEIERQLARIEELAAPDVGPACALIDRGCRLLRIFLEEVAGGQPPMPLKLFPEYDAMQRSRAVRATPADLFFPDLGTRVPMPDAPQNVAADKLASHLVRQRRLYQGGLLLFLRGDVEGARRMRTAVAEIEGASARQSLRAFWWTVGAFFDAIIGRGLEPGLGSKQLAARLDLQIRRLVEGSAKVSDRLRREVLYYVATSAPVAPSVQAVQKGYGLTQLIPPADVLNADRVRLQPILREAREQLGMAKEQWLKVTSGRVDSLPKLKQTLAVVRANVAEFGTEPLIRLTASLAERLDQLPPSGTVPETVAMEYATGVLLAESAVENYGSLAGEFPGQVDAMLVRLDAAQAALPIPDATAPLLDEMVQRAQERVLLVHVAREIQVNLRHMEQVLDAFFRDHAKRAELATLGKDSQQIRGALRILGQDDAEQLLALCQEQIDSYAHPDTVVGDEDLELLAESLSGLGFYVEALEQQRPDRQRLIAPLLAKRLGQAPAAPADRKSETVEAAVEELRSALPALVAEVHRAPADAEARAVLRARLGELVNDAKLIDDSELAAQAQAALAQLDYGGAAALQATVTAIAESSDAASAPAPAISAETQRLLATDATGLDAELLAIYLTEATEVLDTVARNLDGLERSPSDREALRTVRRQFHTLKGSGRMVGLTELGELAFAVEKIHNRLLEEERPVTAAVLAMIGVAERSFRRWIAALRATGSVVADPQELHQAIHAVERDLPSAGAPIVPAPSEVKVAPAEPARAAPDTALELAPALPELGGAPPAPALGQAQWIDEAGSGDEGAAEVIEVAPVGEVSAGAIGADEAAPPPAEVVIGDVALPVDLYQLVVDEAAGHLATLERELSLLQFDPAQRPSAAMVRASHTLCGIHRTAGLPLIASTAAALEQCLLALQRSPAPLSEAALPVLADAVHGLRELAARVATRTGFTASDAAGASSVERALEALRRTLVTEPEPAAPRAAEVPDIAIEEDAAASAGSEPVEPVALHDAVGAAAPSVSAPEPAPEVAPESAFDLPLEPALEVALGPEPGPALGQVPEPASAPVSESARPEFLQDPLADIRDDVDEQVLPIFLEEAAELYPQASAQVREWRRAPGDAASARQLRRTLHTFKGSARMAGAMRLGELAHLMESRLSIDDALAAGTPELFEALDADLDHLAYVLDALRAGRTNVPVPWAGQATEVAPETAPGTPAAAPPEASTAPPTDEAPVVIRAASPEAPPARAAGPGGDGTARAMLRVRADIIDRLVNEAGEVAITRSQIEGELRALKANLLELTGSVNRLRAQVREIEIQAESRIQSRMMQAGDAPEAFDPLEFDRYTRLQELARSLAEGVNDVSTVQQSLLKNLDIVDTALAAQGRLSREVQQQLFSVRTVPFGSLSERLYRILRGTAKELDKRANLEIRGGQTELDRSVLEKLVGPLEHLLRNALAHGIEPHGVRAQAGKSETGEITLTVRQVGNEIAIEIADDGAGLDFEQVRAKAVAQGRISADAKPTDDELIGCIFEAGFSTAATVTQVSGRGIGMDVVRAEIAALGGRVGVSTRAGRGTTFVLHLPLTLAVAQAVLVRAGGRLWALPAPMVEQVQHLKADALVNLYLQRRVEWQGTTYPFHYLPRLLGDTQQIPQSGRHNAVLLLRSGQNVAAVHVDEMVGNQEVVVKNTGPQLARVPGIAGATLLGNGEILLIINPVQLAQRTTLPAFDVNAEQVAPEVPRMAVAQTGRPLVMVVDDSLTVRRITSRLLSREGFDVLTAKDGVEALELLDAETPDVILLDIEMPRMDGFEFTRTIKGNPERARIPIVMITSRTAEKHRNRARDLGVDLYLGKPFQEEELLKHLREMLALIP